MFLLYFGIGCIGIVAGILFRLAAILRLGVPLLYTLVMAFIFPLWAHEHQALSMAILYALLALCALSWIVTIIRKICDRRAERACERLEAEMIIEQLKAKQGIAE